MLLCRVFLYTVLLLSCQKPLPALPPLADNSLKVLFIGNSLTQSNTLPEMVAELARQDDIKIIYKDMSIGGTSLEDHWNDGKIQTEIANDKYDFVVVQQGPSSLATSRANLIEYVKKIKERCDQNNSSLCVYMVWPDKARLAFLDDVIYSYTQAAIQTQSLLAPAGLAWKHAWARDASLPLYSQDDFHPSVMGSVLAALTIYGSIKQKREFNFLHYQKISWKTVISETQFAILKQAALKALGY